MSATEKILLVDDEQQVLDAYNRALRKKFNIETALSGEEGLQTLSDKGPFAVVVSDMRMPVMDGVKFLSQVKKRYPHSIRIMLTGNSDQETAVSAINEGDVFRFLNKPCSPEEMSEAIKAAIQRYHCEAIEQSLLQESTQQLDYLNEKHDNNPEVQRLNALASDIGKLSVLLAKSSGLDKGVIEQCQLAGMMSCMGDLVTATRLKPSPTNQSPPVEPCQLGAYMLGSWGLPNKVVEGIRNHRTPIEPNSNPISLTSVLHAAWYLLEDNAKLPEELQNKTKFAYLSGFAGEEIAKKWMVDHVQYSHKDAGNA